MRYEMISGFVFTMCVCHVHGPLVVSVLFAGYAMFDYSVLNYGCDSRRFIREPIYASRHIEMYRVTEHAAEAL